MACICNTAIRERTRIARHLCWQSLIPSWHGEEAADKSAFHKEFTVQRALLNVLFKPLKQSGGLLSNEGLILTILLCQSSGGRKHMI